mgnify:FL=1
MVNIVEFAHAVALLDRAASPTIVDRALRAAGINREVLRAKSGFVPYAIEAAFLESVARASGERHLGAQAGITFDYSAYGSYASYVLGARDLATAIAHGRRALPLIIPGADIVLRKRRSHVLIGFKSGLGSMIGSRHVEEGAASVITKVPRHFLGAEWRPAWVEMVGDDPADIAALEDLYGVPVHAGAPMPAIAVRSVDLHAANPLPPALEDIVTLSDLATLMGVAEPQTVEAAVREVVRTQFLLGDLSEDTVARRLSMGRRKLQRALKSEGTSFREVRDQFIAARARALLSNSEAPIDEIARSLGYLEPNSFRRAFRKLNGLSPRAYRAAAHGKLSVSE